MFQVFILWDWEPLKPSRERAEKTRGDWGEGVSLSSAPIPLRQHSQYFSFVVVVRAPPIGLDHAPPFCIKTKDLPAKPRNEKDENEVKRRKIKHFILQGVNMAAA